MKKSEIERRITHFANAVTVDSKGTLQPTRLSDAQHTATAIDTLPPVADQLQIGTVLGTGGMGVVHAATQHPLAREVAVKVPRDDCGPSPTYALVREALVHGTLQHPNIVPIHVLGAGETGSPILVMKRVEGQPWSRALSESRADGPQHAELERHLRTLVQVCNAVHYAHSMGVLHLDIKPDNVMTGSFGEVYLLDWGIAHSVDATSRGPLAADVIAPLGTPGYMSPEQALGDGPQLGVRTDVYLLGACLHELICGRAPHDAEQLEASLLSSAMCEPRTYSADVPPELVAIVTRAMQRSVEKRHDDAGQLRDALSTFLEHRPAIELANQAVAKVQQVEDALAGRVTADVFEAFNEARFGLKQSLKQWPHNERATAALQRLLEAMVVREIEQFDLKAASRMLSQLPRPNPALDKRVDDLRGRLREGQEKVDSLNKIARDVDTTVGSEQRRKVMLGLTGFGALYILFGILHHTGVYSAGYGMFAAILGAYFAGVVVLNVVFRRKIERTRTNRQFLTALWMSGLAPAMLVFAGWLWGLPPSYPVILTIMAFLVGGHVFWITVDANPWPYTAVHVACFLIAAFMPDLAFEMLGVATISGLYIGSNTA